MGKLQKYWKMFNFRWSRKQKRFRAQRKRRELRCVQNNTNRISQTDVLLVCTLRNERLRLPYFLQYYRDLGVSHFLFIDNDSDDGSLEYLTGAKDISIWHTKSSYKKAMYGVHWMNWIARQYCHDHWTLTVDVDEFFVFPFSDVRPINALTDWLDSSGIPSFSAMLVDMYPKGPIDAQVYQEGQDPFEIAEWFDSGNYTMSKNYTYQNLWIQGGPRARLFFHDAPYDAPSLNKIPLVKWHRSYVYVQSTHMLLPRRLNQVYSSEGGEKASGALLHAKFLNTFVQKTEEEVLRREHYAGSQEYLAYHEQIKENPELWSRWSERYINWRQLEILGLMSKGDWA